jgi:hypothetical protein
MSDKSIGDKTMDDKTLSKEILDLSVEEAWFTYGNGTSQVDIDLTGEGRTVAEGRATIVGRTSLQHTVTIQGRIGDDGDFYGWRQTKKGIAFWRSIGSIKLREIWVGKSNLM